VSTGVWRLDAFGIRSTEQRCCAYQDAAASGTGANDIRPTLPADHGRRTTAISSTIEKAESVTLRTGCAALTSSIRGKNHAERALRS
jgi:hypothetical protein